jgi:hypothetical protein
MNRLHFMSLLCVLPAAGLAAEIVLPAGALERTAPVTAIYRTNGQATGKGALTVRWTDALGRVVEDRRIAVELTDEIEIRFPVDLRRAVAMANTLSARFSFEGVYQRGAPDRRDESATVDFIAKPPGRAWWDYEIMMWQPHSAERFATLQTLGINAGQHGGRSKTPPAFLVKNNARWYAENIATDFYSEYHRFRSDRIQNWSYLQAKELYKKNPESKDAFKRHPSFSDPVWLRRIHDRLVDSARFFSPYRPVFYDLGDESGIADLAAYWDFDFSDEALGEMRAWLQERYGTLAALNRQWGSSFEAWDQVVPDTTREAMRRTDENYSAWADHKEFMDISYARALQMGAEAVRSVDPDAYVGVAGAQMPGWGGYDYSRLAQAINAIEPYDIGNNIEIIRSLNPRMAFVTTSFARGPWEKHRIWYELLHGARGNIIWDEKNEHVSAEGAVGERGNEVAPYYRELRGGLAALLIASTRQADPIAIHYSQASMRTEWMRAQRPKGEAWVDRTSSTERRDSEFLRVRESWCRLVEDLGLQYSFVAYGQVEDGELLKRGYRVLILPRSSSLSAAEAAAIRDFVARGGLLIADGVPGAFDEHSRRLPNPALEGLYANLSVLDYHQQRLVGKEGPTVAAFQKLVEKAGVRPAYAVAEGDGAPAVGVETHTFRNGGVTIVGLLTNPQLRVDELGPPEFRSNQRFEKPRPVRLTLPAEMYAYDIRAARALGRKKELSVTLDPYEPAVFAFSMAPLPGLQMSAPERVARGETAAIALRPVGLSPAEMQAIHIDVIDPDGKPALHYSGNVLARNGAAERLLPIAQSDKPGKWTIRAHDLISGSRAMAAVEVY